MDIQWQKNRTQDTSMTYTKNSHLQEGICLYPPAMFNCSKSASLNLLIKTIRLTEPTAQVLQHHVSTNPCTLCTQILCLAQFYTKTTRNSENESQNRTGCNQIVFSARNKEKLTVAKLCYMNLKRKPLTNNTRLIIMESEFLYHPHYGD